MKNSDDSCRLADEDIRSALVEMKAYVDVTEEDLRKIYEIALRHARKRLALRLPVHEVMTSNVVTVTPEAGIQHAAKLLSDNRISGMPVVDKAYRVIGVISEADILMTAGMGEGHTFRDVLRRLMGEPFPARKTGSSVEDVMSFPPITCKADDDLREVAALLDNRRIKRLPVVDDRGKLVGIISRGDIVRMIGRKQGGP